MISYKNIFKLLGKLADNNIVIPLYHTVSNTPSEFIQSIYSVKSEKEFRDDLDFFQSNFEIVDAQTLLNCTKQNPSKPLLHLTFDDGLREIADVVAPILREKGIPATFFITTQFVGNQEFFYRFKASYLNIKLNSSNLQAQQKAHKILEDNHIQGTTLRDKLFNINYLNQNLLDKIAESIHLSFAEILASQKPFLEKEQVQQLALQGFNIGAHSINHPNYHDLSLNEQVLETEQSMQTIIDWVNPPVRFFAFPYSDIGVSRAFFDNIYRPDGIIDLSFGTSGIKKDQINRNIQRVPLENPFRPAQPRLLREYSLAVAKRLLNKDLIKR
jgi:peptidoglycan/xylan/chitin deacetylase (PgdA/CDA1 family)